ncbi:MAG TPA: lipopolysaccharide assembly protein LapA domain-containing protein [Acidimicrobiales bacterium]|nr:lipopolysaccharide assembly protein LapA domain-containing protein [Acidimicrobiales bacterium]
MSNSSDLPSTGAELGVPPPDATAAVPVDAAAAVDRPSAQAEVPGKGARRRRQAREDRAHTRISGAWAAVTVGVVVGIALIDFVVENTRSVRVDFFSASGRMPVAVALLAAAAAGATVVLVVGICRTTQLRLSIRRRRGKASANATSATQDSALVTTEDRP